MCGCSLHGVCCIGSCGCCLCHYKSKLSTHWSSGTNFSQDEIVPLYKMVLAWLEHYSSQLIQLVYHFCFPVNPNNTYKLNQSRTPPKLTFFENVLVNMFTMILVTVQRSKVSLVPRFHRSFCRLQYSSLFFSIFRSCAKKTWDEAR